jgi:hypothetical protein
LGKEEDRGGHTATEAPWKAPNPVLTGPRFVARAYWDDGLLDEGGNMVWIPIIVN